MRRRSNNPTKNEEVQSKVAYSHHEEMLREDDQQHDSTEPTEGSDDQRFTVDRLNQLRLKVAARELNAKIERIMNFYYLILFGLGFNFYRMIGKYGIDLAVTWHCIGGMISIVVAGIMYLFSSRYDNANFTAVSGMLAITGLPVIAIALCTYLWVSMFFKPTWRNGWLSLVSL
mmetsp:Transcript_83704/g.162779  ORF Transcript_83704/g.162779 Transcript_83704/m.162779 type:complete len:173 (-) Transcript_83704:159-677(-)